MALTSRALTTKAFHRRAIKAVIALIATVVLTTILVPTAAQATGALTSSTWQTMDSRRGAAGNRYDWATTTATQATISKVTASVPNGTSASGPHYLGLNATPGNYAWTPSSTANTVSGDLDIRAYIKPTSWTGSYQTIAAKYGNSTRSYRFDINSGGTLSLYWSTDGTFSTEVNTSTSTVMSGSTLRWVRATLQASDGSGNHVVRFYTSTDGNSWTPFGNVTTAAGVVSPYAGNAHLDIGTVFENTDWFNGNIYYVDVRNAIGGTTTSPSGCSAASSIVSCFDPSAVPATTAWGSPTWTSAAPTTPAESWTLVHSNTATGSDIVTDLSVANLAGLPGPGKAQLRLLDGVVSYAPTTPQSIAAGTPIKLGVMGLINSTAGSASQSYTSTLTTYDTTPAAVDTAATSNSVTLSAPTSTLVGGSTPIYSSTTTATAADMMPDGLAISGNSLYVADRYSSSVDQVNLTNGNLVTVTGNGRTANGVADNTPALSAYYWNTQGVVVDGSGNLYLTDGGGGSIRRITSGTEHYFAGTGASGYNGDGTALTHQLSSPNGMATDASGNVYVADTSNNLVREITTAGNIVTVAGGGVGGDGGAATSAALSSPFDVALDGSGNLYIADASDNAIRKVSGGIITTVAGTLGSSGNGGDGGLATAAHLSSPRGIAVDANGSLYIADYFNNRIRKVDYSTLKISTIAGNGTGGFSGDGGSATTAQLWGPAAVRVDSSGNVYDADFYNGRVRKIDTSGNISTIAGTGVSSYRGDGGPVSQARFWFPEQMASDAAGNLYVADMQNNAVRKVDRFGTVTTIAGKGPGSGSDSGDTGPATAAGLAGPEGIAVDTAGNIYIADANAYTIRKIAISTGNISTVASMADSPTRLGFDNSGNLLVATANNKIYDVTLAGAASLIAGTGSAGNGGDGGPATSATFSSIRGFYADTAGNVYVADSYNGKVRKINAAGIVTTVLGGGGGSGNNVSATGSAYGGMTSIFPDTLGGFLVSNASSVFRFNENGMSQFIGNLSGGGSLVSTLGSLYQDDYNNSSISKLTDMAPYAPQMEADQINAAKSTAAVWPVESNDLAPLGEMDPNSVTITANPSHGTAVVNTSYGQITTVAYTPTAGYTGSDSFTYSACDSTLINCGSATASVTVSTDQVTTVVGPMGEGPLNTVGVAPGGVAHSHNYLYFTDTYFQGVRRLDLYSGMVTNVAGAGNKGYSGDGQAATSSNSSLNSPVGIVVDPNGTVYFSDNGNGRVRSVSTGGILSTVLGGGATSPNTSGVTGTSLALSSPWGLAFAQNGSLDVAAANSIQQLRADTKSYTIAGTLTAGSSGDGGTATSAQLNGPRGISLNSSTNALYIADYANKAIRKLSGGILTTVAGQLGVSGTAGDGVSATSATFTNPSGVSVDTSGGVYVADTSNTTLRRFIDGGNIAHVTGYQGQSPANDVLAGNGTDVWISDGADYILRYLNTSATYTTIAGSLSQIAISPDGLPGQLTQSGFGWTRQLLVDASNNVYFIDQDHHSRELNGSTNLVSTLLSGQTYNDGQNGIDSSGRIYFTAGCQIERLNIDRSVTVIAGSISTCTDTGNGTAATSATLNNPRAITVGPDGSVYVSETSSYVRKIDPLGKIWPYGGTGVSGDSGDGGAATSAKVANDILTMALDKSGNLLMVEKAECDVRMIDTSGNISTIFGQATVCTNTGNGGKATAATSTNDNGIDVDADNNIYIGSTGDVAIRKIDASTGIVNIVVGGNNPTSFTDNTTATAAMISPRTVEIAPNGNLYFADSNTTRIRMVKNITSNATNDLSKVAWTVTPAAIGHPNLRENFSVTPAVSATSASMSFTMPTGVTGTPTVVSSFGISGTASASLSGTTLTVTYPSQTLAAGVPVGFVLEGWTSGGSNASLTSSATEYDASATAIGWARSGTVALTSGAGAPSVGGAGYASVLAKSLTSTVAPSAFVSTSPFGYGQSSVSVSSAGNINTNTWNVAASGQPTAITTAQIPGTTTNFSTSNTAGTFSADTWGVSITTSTGALSGALGAGAYSGVTTGAQTAATAAASTNSLTVVTRARVDYLTPAGIYTNTLAWRIVPGS